MKHLNAFHYDAGAIGPRIRLNHDFIGGLVDDIGKVAGNVIGGKDPFNNVGGIAHAVGTVVGTVDKGVTAAKGAIQGATQATNATAPVTVGGTTFDATPLVVLMAIAALIYVSQTQPKALAG